MRLLLLIVGALLCAAVEAREPLTSVRALETTRIMMNMEAVGPANPHGVVSVSPSGKRYVLRLVRGDVARNGVCMDMYTGYLDDLEAVRPKKVATLFTSGLGAGLGNFGSDMDVMDVIPLRWLNDDEVVFPWSNERSVRQVTRVNLRTGQVDRLTSHPTPVVGFDVATDGTVLYYARAQTVNRTAEMEERGFVLPSDVDAYSLFHRNLNVTAYDVAWNTQWFVQKPGRSEPQALTIAGRSIDLVTLHRVQFAPDGRTAAVTSAPQRYPQEWNAYQGPERAGITAARRDPRNGLARIVQQLYIVDVTSGASRPLWNTVNSVSEVRWSPDGRWLLVAPTYLPPPVDDAAALAGSAAAVVEVGTGEYQRLPVDLRGRGLPVMRWVSATSIEMGTRQGDDVQRLQFRKRGEQWRDEPAGLPAKSSPPLRLELRQDLNAPPRIYAVGEQEALLVDPNPDLADEVTLGRVEIVEGAFGAGDSWRGYLFYPVNHRPGQRYPLLVQSIYGAGLRSEFTLYGAGTLGPPLIACYPGQVMANRGVAVLHVNVHMGAKFGTAEEAETRKNGLTAAVEQLIAEGLVERNKVGLVGFSRNGWYAEYSITHEGFPYAAVVAADNWDPSYSATLMMGVFEGAAEVNGAPAFGDGLLKWLEKAPGFGVERIESPLMKIEQSTAGLFGVLVQWETVARMRYLKKPLEYYVMPDAARHGSHTPQNPGQILAVQQRVVDWFDFWLNGHVDPDERKTEQYAAWRRMRGD